MISPSLHPEKETRLQTNETMQEDDFLFWINPVVRWIYLHPQDCVVVNEDLHRRSEEEVS